MRFKDNQGHYLRVPGFKRHKLNSTERKRVEIAEDVLDIDVLRNDHKGFYVVRVRPKKEIVYDDHLNGRRVTVTPEFVGLVPVQPTSDKEWKKEHQGMFSFHFLNVLDEDEESPPDYAILMKGKIPKQYGWSCVAYSGGTNIHEKSEELVGLHAFNRFVTLAGFWDYSGHKGMKVEYLHEPRGKRIPDRGSVNPQQASHLQQKALDDWMGWWC